jgi:hypothetical protein
MESPYLEKRDSPIHGIGVFAKVDIPRQTKLVPYLGIEMTYQEFVKKYGDDWRYTYRRVPWLKQIVAKEIPPHERCLACFVNDGIHGSDNPKVNCYFKKGYLWSLLEIKAGEELLLDYGPKYWKSKWVLMANR